MRSLVAALLCCLSGTAFAEPGALHFGAILQQASSLAGTRILAPQNDPLPEPSEPPRSEKMDRELKIMVEAWGGNAKEDCVSASETNPSGATNQETVRLIAAMNRGSVGAGLIALARDLNAMVCQGPLFGEKAFFESKALAVVVNRDLNFWQKAVVALHELQHLNQYAQGFERTLDYSLDEAVRFTFVIEADAEAIATLGAWEIAQLGYPQIREARWSFVRYRNIITAFETTMSDIESGKKPLPDGMTKKQAATQAAFLAWFETPWLTGNYRGQAKNMFLDDLDESKRIQRYHHAPSSYYDKLCKIPGGFGYDCQAVMPSAEGIADGPTRHLEPSEIEE